MIYHPEDRGENLYLVINGRVKVSRPAENQMLHLLPITHEQLACYVGTSREIVTRYMNRLRREGLLEYSRRGIDLDVAALERHLASG